MTGVCPDLPVIRDDLSSRHVHLTKGTPDEAAASFCSILKDKKLRDFKGQEEDGCHRICFSEAPLSKLGQLIASAHSGFTYQYFGITLEKQWLFERGGRPVVYQPARERDLLHASARYRHVTYDPADPGQRDVTFEREWRIPVAELPLDPVAMTLVVPTRAWAYRARDGRRGQVQVNMLITRGFGGRQMTEDPWYFLVLEDLGIPITGAPEPPDDWFPEPVFDETGSDGGAGGSGILSP
jgi:hypothetical protein